MSPSILRIVAPYAAFSALWILISDTALEALLQDKAAFAQASIYKGWFFIAVTSALLVGLLRVQLRERQRAFQELQARMAEQTRELAEARRFLDALVDHIASPIFYKGADLRFRGCNRAYEQAFGIERKDFIGRTVLDLEYLPAPDRDAYQAEDAAMVAACSTTSREAAIPFADGRVHQTLYSVSGFRAPDGTPGGLVGIIVDITPLKDAEAALREAKVAAESADRLKSAFLATMSHELRTPLNSIIGFSGILLAELPGPLNAEQRKQLGMVCASSEHLLALINDVLDLSKIEAGQLQTESAPFLAEPSIRRVVETVRPLAEKKGLALDLDLGGDLGEIVSDRRRVEQVLLNLLSNGVKFTDRGRVHVTAGRRDGVVEVVVTDTGKGIAGADLGRLWKPFSQIETGLDRRHEGTGLGLSICKRLVELLGGSIWVESEEGRGSSFGFRLPAGTVRR
ncbi:MAG: PAS domain-containing protein [Polyangiaceae bacterium]|nr:PAS domain-containing protein [Polyangiaceae bacterium]